MTVRKSHYLKKGKQQQQKVGVVFIILVIGNRVLAKYKQAFVSISGIKIGCNETYGNPL
jgi:uncharacterized membrane protein YwzB